MNKLLILGFALALTSMDCGSSGSDSSGTNTLTSTSTNTGTGTCQGANANTLVASCTIAGQCFEEYSPSVPVATVVKSVQDACTSFGGTASASPCVLSTVGCTCTDTSGAYKTITHFDDAAYCSDCTGTCKSAK